MPASLSLRDREGLLICYCNVIPCGETMAVVSGQAGRNRGLGFMLACFLESYDYKFEQRWQRIHWLVCCAASPPPHPPNPLSSSPKNKHNENAWQFAEGLSRNNAAGLAADSFLFSEASLLIGVEINRLGLKENQGLFGGFNSLTQCQLSSSLLCRWAACVDTLRSEPLAPSRPPLCISLPLKLSPQTLMRLWLVFAGEEISGCNPERSALLLGLIHRYAKVFNTPPPPGFTFIGSLWNKRALSNSIMWSRFLSAIVQY